MSASVPTTPSWVTSQPDGRSELRSDGSLIGPTAYGLKFGFAPERPQQLLRCIDSERGFRSRPRYSPTTMDHYIDETFLISKGQARKAFRRSILEAWDGRCAYCGRPGCTIDHPPRAEGVSTAARTPAACAECNGRKASHDWVQWFRLQHFWDPEREGRAWLWLFQNA